MGAAQRLKEAGRQAAEVAPPSRPRDEDDRLLKRIALGEEAAFRRLVERHVDKGYALALRILRNPADAEDVVQDALVKVWTNRGTWRAGNARFSTWLYRVITNRCIDLCRRPRTSDVDDVPELPDGKTDAVSTIHIGEVNLLLERAMGKLPNQQRIALILSYHDDLSNPEIAEIMDTTISAVESLLKRGRQQLRAILMTAEAEIRESFTKD